MNPLEEVHEFAERRDTNPRAATPSEWDLDAGTLQRLGQEVGVDAIGATTADPFPELAPRLQAYEDRGRTGFEEGDISARLDPCRWFPPATSLVAVAIAYVTEEGYRLARSHPSDGTHGQVTVYSFGEDYHRVLEERLALLAERIEQVLGRKVQYKVAVDTSPLVDRRVAERAGIGWVGKNCHLFTADHGSFVFLGTLAIDVAIEPAREEQPWRCEDCDLCMKACPTGAIIAPGVIDAKRCLSYVTQMKGIIPEPYREPLGRRVWGCDTCQWACPENHGVARSSHDAFLPSGELEFPDLIEILHWSNRQFLKRYGHTAAAWRGLRTWQRNALIALGNARRQSAVPEVLPFLQHQRRELRASAAWALGKLGGLEAKHSLEAASAIEQDEEVKIEMVSALDRMERTEEDNAHGMGSGSSG